MKHRNVEAARELRLWLIALTTGFIAAKKYVSEHPDAEKWVNDRVERITKKFKKADTTEAEPEREKIIKVIIVREDEET